jgi:hypothetical protein
LTQQYEFVLRLMVRGLSPLPTESGFGGASGGEAGNAEFSVEVAVRS